MIKGIPPLENFTHTFTESREPEPALCAQADVILADLRETDAAEAVRALETGRKDGAELIVLAEGAQAALLAEDGRGLTDIWTGPLPEAELRFRFRKWQRDYKLRMDNWQTGNFLDACINSTPGLVWFKDKNGVHEKVNDRFCAAVGKTPSQIQGQRHAYIWNVEEDDPACIESEQTVMETGKTCVAEETVQTGNGTILLTTYKSPLYDLDSSVMGTVGIAIDATKERLYEQKLLEKNHTLEMLFSTLDCGVMCHSIDGQELVSINQAALRLLGYESQEDLMTDGFRLVAQSVLDEDKPKLRSHIKSLQQIGDNVSVEYRVRHRDGKLLHILGNVKLIEEDGRQLYQRFLLDVTAQKLKDEEEQAEKEREFQYREHSFQLFSNFLANNIDDVYIMVDAAANKIEFVSGNVERVLGLSLEKTEDFREQLSKVRYLTGRPVTLQELEAMQPGMSLKPRETERIHLKTGEHRWFRESVYCVSIQGEKKIIVYISDRTAERQSQDVLREALKMAQAAGQAKSLFMSNVSHDIRTPMNAIMGMIALLRDEADHPDRVREYTQKISVASQHLLGLINDVLDMSKLESGSAVLNIGVLNLANLIDGLNTIIRPQAREKQQTFEVFTAHLAHERLLGDKLRINQILLNILSNAVKYTPAGGRIEMRVEELSQADPGYSRIRFTVADNGQGMSEEYMKVIFDPFTREQDTKLNEIQGTGLGMAITKSLVDLMNGTIRVASRPGYGSTFTVELELPIQKQGDDLAFWSKHGIKRMLLADGEDEICRNVARKMEEAEVQTDCAADSRQAMDMIRSAYEAGQPYQLILLDWKLPGLDGAEMVRRLRKDYPSRTPVLLFSAYDWNDIKQETAEIGVERFMPKPFFMSNFRAAVERMMRRVEPEASDSGSGSEENVLAGKRILVVDDIAINRMILMKILTSQNAVCEEAQDGQEAVEKFNAKPDGYDIILMDLQMPVMNGYEATRAIRASDHPSARKIAIIALTANAFVDDVRNSLEAGMDAHVAKPIVLDKIRDAAAEVLARKKNQ